MTHLSFSRRHCAWLMMLCALMLTTPPLYSQKVSYNDSLYNALEYRNIGPFRGGAPRR